MASIDFTARDYESIRQSLLSRVPELLPEWRGRDLNDFGMVMVELFSYLGDQLGYYIDRSINEAFLQTAVMRSSVLFLAEMLGYVPNDMVPASGTVTFTVEAGAPEVTIPERTVLISEGAPSDAGPYFYTTEAEVTLPAGGGEVSVSVLQGEVINDETVLVSSGAPSQTASLFMSGVVRSTIVVLVTAGTTTYWSQTPSLLDAAAGDRVYEVTLNEQGVAFLTFGDGANGAIPTANAIVTASYRVAVGSLGNVEEGAVTAVKDEIPFVTSVTNSLPISGGVDMESVDSIRRSAPRSLKTIERAVTVEDFSIMAARVPGVLHSSADALVYTSVLVYVVPVGGGVPSTALQTAIDAYFVGPPQRTLIGVDVTVMDPTYVGVNINVNLAVRSGYYQADVTTAITDALTALLDLDRVGLGFTLTVNAVYDAMREIDGTDYTIVTLLAREDALQSGVDNVVFALNECPIVGTIEVIPTGGVV